MNMKRLCHQAVVAIDGVALVVELIGVEPPVSLKTVVGTVPV